MGAALADVTGLVSELTADPTALPTDEVTSLTGVLAAESSVAPADPGPVTAGAAEVTDGCAPGFWSSVAAWACLVKMNRRKKIPAAAIANCATRTVTRYASCCDIDRSHPLETEPRRPGAEGPRIGHAGPLRTRRFCTVTTVHHRRLPDKY